MPKVEIREEALREGFQIESAAIPTDSKRHLLTLLSRTGLEWINVGSFVSPRYTPQMADIDALLESFEPVPGVNYYYLALNQRGHERAAEFPFLVQESDTPLLAVHLDRTFSLRNSRRTPEDEMAEWPAIVEEARLAGATSGAIGLFAAWGSNFEGAVSPELRLSRLSQAADLWSEAGIPVTELYLADPMSWCMPHEVEDGLSAMLREFPDIHTVHLHLHNGRGMALPSIYAALKPLEGRTLRLDTSLGGIGGCPYCGNGRATGMAATEDVVSMFQSMGALQHIDLKALIEAAWYLEELIGRPVPGFVSHVGPRPTTTELYDENLPVIETHEEARHFLKGMSAISSPRRPWPTPIPSRAKETAR